MADLMFLTGPTRSGKSRRAVEIAQAWGDGVVLSRPIGPIPATPWACPAEIREPFC